ncbi:hypothetical protein F5Y01DRAFT_318290 [Xylaria sp. FL0043]|nr:hypothetical protein F5Y01DRAFT_318290 [Xylaria sp. FL0043]
MSLPIAGSPDPPPYAAQAPSSGQHNTNTDYDHRHAPRLAPWQRGWNLEWLNEAIIPEFKYRVLRLHHLLYTKRGGTQEELDVYEDRASGIIGEMIEAGFVSQEHAHKRTWFHRALRRYTCPFQLMAHEVKAFKQCWYDFKNKDKLWRVTAVMEEQGENPRWKAEMTFIIQPKQYEQMVKTGQWIEFPSPEDIKWLYVTGPDGIRRLHATDRRHWGPKSKCGLASLPFDERNGRIVRRRPTTLKKIQKKFHLFAEPRQCSHCGHIE